jgi:hypothetical protein
MARASTSFRWIIAGLTVLGIGYNFILPFTPTWLDIVAWVAITAAFLIALIMGLIDKKRRG